MPLPTTITWAGSWLEPEPCMTDTLSARGISVRMIRLYSGTYFSVSGLARAIPLSISGTNFFGSLTNFFMPESPWNRIGCLCLPGLADVLKYYCNGDCAGVQGADAALAR